MAFQCPGFLVSSMIIGMVVCVVSSDSVARNVLETEFSFVFPEYNDVRVPGDSGTRFSLTDDLGADQTQTIRFRYGHIFSKKHWVGLLIAPLRVESSGLAPETINFNGVSFAQGSHVDATFQFDSYRLIYRYQFYDTNAIEFSFGGALKIRDASIKLNSSDVKSEKSNVGFVPLLSFNFTWKPYEKLHFIVDGEALAAPQGRAEDVLFAAQYHLNPSIALKVGYRVLEGGADNDEVYTFSFFHQAIVGFEWFF